MYCANFVPSLNICSSCQAALRKHDKVPHLTWIEEKVCAVYCLTAHVTRLFQSSDPAQPKAYHGNMCAHEMNVVSTASVLPRTPADINGLLSVVFVGPGKFNPNVLGTVFRVRRSKIWGFLVWLKHHNRLYSTIRLDSTIALMYPEDDLLPGLRNVPWICCSR
ncbi:uncharacterized protein F5891DRAFT_1130989 [Suillus fuscotomentosus]|uniref:DUF6570 domain-containing protein n=1 Tax=Suillus fuscotomentosus TaxID=1912939 RepID=A0AAD4HFA1_9AGAM|nr:uncharacterized protein F5891DRAFT_1130989 [Suillus fuscotomentosus]KAG1894372.1 hypothetical protein F5891DRAFT_1130989 [Suillus fuscotomentosus]